MLALKVIEEAYLLSREDGAILLGGPVMEADVADFWHNSELCNIKSDVFSVPQIPVFSPLTLFSKMNGFISVICFENV